MTVRATSSASAAPPAAIDPAAPEPQRPQDAVRCPLCDYDLRGLTEPRCPECGYRFVWADLTDPEKRRHPFLFEHHPNRNLWSFAQTLARGWLPRRFWGSIHPSQRSRPGRLVFYWCAAASFLVAALVAHFAVRCAEEVENALRMRTRIAQMGGYTAADLNTFYPLPPGSEFFVRVWHADAGWAMRLLTLWLAWPWLVFVTLLLFRVSMRRARIRPAHMLRCVLYSCDAVFWLGLVVAAVVGQRALHWYGTAPPRVLVPPAPIPSDHFFQYSQHPVTDALFWGGLLMLLLTGYRLAAAMRRYLRFDHPVATVAAAYLIASLILLVAFARRWV